MDKEGAWSTEATEDKEGAWCTISRGYRGIGIGTWVPGIGI